MRKVIVSLAPVRAGDAVDANALAEDVKKVWMQGRRCVTCTVGSQMEI